MYSPIRTTSFSSPHALVARFAAKTATKAHTMGGDSSFPKNFEQRLSFFRNPIKKFKRRTNHPLPYLFVATALLCSFSDKKTSEKFTCFGVAPLSQKISDKSSFFGSPTNIPQIPQKNNCFFKSSMIKLTCLMVKN